jgi:hypothetical protein
MSKRTVLTLRELNRAHLARQLLLRREKLSPVAAVERLAGLQAQWPPSPYVSLWSRLEGFEREALSRPIERLEVVKATLLRTTLHLVTAREYPMYALATAERRLNTWRPRGGGEGLPELLERLHARALDFARGTPRTRQEIVEHLEPHLPDDARLRDYSAWAMLGAGSLLLEPACALWDHRRDARYLAAPKALRAVPDTQVAHGLLVRRYLAAFGPATLRDLASWSGARMPPLREAVERLGDELKRFTDERGRELFDLERAPRPSPDVAAPPRFLPRFDNAILGHEPAERERILPNRHRRAVIFAAEVRATFLVDGFVSGTWDVRSQGGQAVLRINPFARLSGTDRVELVEEAGRLVQFIEPEAKTHRVAVLATGPTGRTRSTRLKWTS